MSVANANREASRSLHSHEDQKTSLLFTCGKPYSINMAKDKKHVPIPTFRGSLKQAKLKG